MCLVSGGGRRGCGLACAVGGAGGPAGVHDRGVLPVTPFAPWCFVPGCESGAGGDHVAWVLSLRARRSDSVFPAPPPPHPPPCRLIRTAMPRPPRGTTT